MSRREPQNLTWSRRSTGPNAEVWMHERCIDEMKELGKARAKIQACMDKMYCQMERSDQVPPAKLNRNEGRHGPNKLLVQAFKNGQGRVYGVEGSIRGKRTFFAALAVVKKKQKADPGDLSRAAERVASVLGLVSGACL